MGPMYKNAVWKWIGIKTFITKQRELWHDEADNSWTKWIRNYSLKWLWTSLTSALEHEVGINKKKIRNKEGFRERLKIFRVFQEKYSICIKENRMKHKERMRLY